jgi:F0F1-type ATP synthase assembly protein I
MEPEEQEKVKKITKNYMKYSGLAFQMLGLLVISFLLGNQVDKFIGNAKPLIAITFTMLMFGGYMYKLYKELQ